MKHIVINPNTKTVEIVEPLDMSQMLALVEDDYVDSELAGEYELIVGDSSLFNRSFHLTNLTVNGRRIGPLCGPIIIVPNTDRQISDAEITTLAEDIKENALFMARQDEPEFKDGPEFKVVHHASADAFDDDDIFFFDDDDILEDDTGPT